MRFTVFTPTYNRATTLARVHDSLVAQTMRDFEWLIVDDGSTDGTRALVEGWRAAAPFDIRYVWQENGGKHRAWNRGVDEARGELFAEIDSDDGCKPEALEAFERRWAALPATERERLAGVIGRCLYPDGTPVGPPLPQEAALDFAELMLVHGYRADLWIVTRTDVLRRIKQPQGPRGRLVPEGTLWHAIAKHYRWALLDEPLKIYYTGAFGSTDQLSRPRPLAEQAPGLALAYTSLLANSWRHFRDAPLTFARSAAHLARFSLHDHRSPIGPLGTFPDPGARALYGAMLPVGVAAYVLDKLRRR